MTKPQPTRRQTSLPLYPSLSDSFRTDYASPYTTISRYRRQHEQLQRLQRQRELEERRARLQRLAAANQGHSFFNRLPVNYFNPASAASTGKAASQSNEADKQFPFFFGFGTMDDGDPDTFDKFYILHNLLTTCKFTSINVHFSLPQIRRPEGSALTPVPRWTASTAPSAPGPSAAGGAAAASAPASATSRSWRGAGASRAAAAPGRPRSATSSPVPVRIGGQNQTACPPRPSVCGAQSSVLNPP